MRGRGGGEDLSLNLVVLIWMWRKENGRQIEDGLYNGETTAWLAGDFYANERILTNEKMFYCLLESLERY